MTSLGLPPESPICGAGELPVHFRLPWMTLVTYSFASSSTSTLWFSFTVPLTWLRMKPNQKPCGYPGSETTHPSNHELYLAGRIESPVCNACEISRRSELGLEVAHARPKRPACVTNNGPAEATGNTTTTAKELTVPEQQPTEAQRPTSLPGLLGPLGYDAGR